MPDADRAEGGAPQSRAWWRRWLGRGHGPLWLRLVAGFVFEVASTAVVVGVPGWWLVRHADLGALAGQVASARLGRAVQVGHLRLTFGDVLIVEAADVAIGNLPGGSVPEMLTLQHIVATLEAGSVLHGPVLIRTAEVDGLAVLLEHVGEQPNWRNGPKLPVADPTHRTGFPSLRDLVVRGSQVVFRTREGRDLVTKLDDVHVHTDADDGPAKLVIAGSYNAVPVTVDADLQPITVLRQAAVPYGTVLHFASGETRLDFDGTMTNPLDFDGHRGTLELHTPDPTPLFAAANVKGGLVVQVDLDGAFERDGPAWRWTGVKGQLGQDEVTAATLTFDEARPADRIGVDVGFATLDVGALMGDSAKDRGSDGGMSLETDARPASEIELKLAAKEAEYRGVRAAGVALRGSRKAGRMVVDSLSMEVFGSRVVAHGEVVEAPGGGRVSGVLEAVGADVQTLRRQLGVKTLPLYGRLEIAVVLEASGKTMDAALRGARVSGVAAMRGGSVSKDVVEKASTDVRTLFRKGEGTSAVVCLLAGVDMRGGAGVVAPLRLRAADGTISGAGRFDLYRRTVDVTIGSEARSTGPFALDIPVHLAGPIADPSVSPGAWSAEGRAQLAAADSLGALPVFLREWARRYACPASR